MGKDRVLTVQYKGGEKKVLVPEKRLIVSFTPVIAASSSPGPKSSSIRSASPTAV